MALAPEVASAEISKWLDAKKIPNKRREARQAQIDSLVSALVEGSLVLKDNGEFDYSLRFPLESESEQVKLLTFKQRIKVGTLQLQMQSVKPGDTMGTIVAHVATLTAQPKALIGLLDTEDYEVASSIAIFFM